MGAKLEDIRALITMVAVIFAAYLPFYIGGIKLYIYEESMGYYLIIEGIQAIGGIAISIYFSVRRIEGKHKREPLNLPRHGIRIFLLCNAIISFFLGIHYYALTQDMEMINLPFLFSMIVGLFTWLWPSQEEMKQELITQTKKKRYDPSTKYKRWELKQYTT
ncbi:MAG: hypothetical protein ACFFDN_32715 [Candidatus Hodarchaeota archaeon]